MYNACTIHVLDIHSDIYGTLEILLLKLLLSAMVDVL